MKNGNLFFSRGIFIFAIIILAVFVSIQVQGSSGIDASYSSNIKIIKAAHLNEDRNLISDIFSEVEELDGIWSEEISNGEYVRVTFAEKLDSNRDITLYPRVISGNPKIEVYEKGKDEVIAEFSNLRNDSSNRVFLTGLLGTQDSFDLRVLNGIVQFDHIIDPASSDIGWWTESGEVNLSDATTTPVNLSQEVNTSKTFILLSRRTGTSQDEPSDSAAHVEWVNNTQFNLVKSSSEGGAFYVWHAIEGNNIYVQNGTQAFTPSETAFNISINSVNVSRAVAFMTFSSCNSTDPADNNQIFWTGNVTNSTNLYIQRDDSGICSGTVAYFVVEFNDGSSIQRGEISNVGATASPSYAIVNTINQSNTWFYFSQGSDNTAAGLNDVSVIAEYYNDTAFRVSREAAGGNTRAQWYAITTPNSYVQNSVDPYMVNNDTTINGVVLNRSFSLISFNNSGGGTTYANTMGTSLLTNTTNLHLQRGTSSNTEAAAWQVIFLPEVFTDPTLTSVVLNSTSYNITSDNLTAYPVGASGASSLIYDWRLNDTSIAVLNMPFDTNDTTGARDYSSYSNNATCDDNTTCPNWTSSGISGGAINVSSDSEGMEIPYSDEFNFTDQITIMAWVKQSATHSDEQSIIRRNCCDILMAPWVDFVLETNITGFPQFVPQTASGPVIKANGNLTLDTWAFLAATYNGSLVSLYVNGVLNNTGSTTGNIANTNASQSITIGTNDLYAPESFKGLIDGVIILNRSLSAEQIRAMYNAGAPKYDLLVSNETSLGDNWTVAVTPNNMTDDGTTVLSNYLEILALDNPSLTSVVLNSTSTSNDTTGNLTAYPISATNYTTLIYDWRVNDTSVAILNLPFDTNVSNNNSGAVRDYSTFSFNATLAVGEAGGGDPIGMPTWVYDSTLGGGYDFDGVNDSIYVPQTIVVNNSNGTYEVWMQANSGGDSSYLIMGQSMGGTFNNYCYSLTYYPSPNQLYLITNGAAPTPSIFINLESQIRHVVVTFNTTNVAFYIDGDLQQSFSSAHFCTQTPSSQFWIGRAPDQGTNRDFNGTIYGAKVYNKTLTPEQIRAMYNNGVPRYNLTVSNETAQGDNWTVAVTPNNITDDGTTALSNYLVTGTSCNCPTTGANWQIDLSQSCLIDTDCNIGAGNITWANTGTATFNSTITAYRMDPPPSGGTVYIGDQCMLNLG